MSWRPGAVLIPQDLRRPINKVAFVSLFAAVALCQFRLSIKQAETLLVSKDSLSL